MTEHTYPPADAGFWRTAHGVIAIPTMSDAHLSNAVASAERFGSAKLVELQAELAWRQHAGAPAGQEVDHA